MLNKNFIIYGGDLISNLNLFEVIDFHHLNRASLTTVLLKDPNFEKKQTQAFSRPRDFTMIYGLEEDTNRLVISTPSDLIGQEGIKLKSSVLARHPRIYFEDNLLEANIIIMDFSLIKVLQKFGEKFPTFTEDFIPFLLQYQYNENLRKILHTNTNNQVVNFINSHLGEDATDIRPFAYITSDFCIRIDQNADYHQANIDSISKNKLLQCFKPTNNNLPLFIYKAAPKEEGSKKKKVKTKISGNILAEGFEVGQSVVQRCVVGEGVTIQNGCKIVNSILMEGCQIGNNCTIQNCFIGRDAIIHDDCTLKVVRVKSEVTVPAKSEVEKDMLL